MKKYLVNILTMCVSAIIIVIVSECVLRWTDIAYEPQYDNRIKITQKSKYPKIRYELIPHYKGVAYGGLVSVNSFGFRGPEVSQKKPEGIKRIAVIGDSWAFGWGVNQHEVVTRVLEKKLNEYKKESFEVLNFSLFGYSLEQEEAVLNKKVLAFEPDYVIFAFNINDLEGLKTESINDMQAEYGNRTSASMQKADLTGMDKLFKTIRGIEKIGNNWSHLFRLADNAIRGLAIYLNFDNPGKKMHYKQFYKDDAKEFIFLKRSYQHIADMAKLNEFKVCIIYFPWMNELKQNNPYKEEFERVINVAEKNGFSTMSLFPYYRGQDVRKLRISNIDGHPTALGHKIAADAIADFILPNLITD